MNASSAHMTALPLQRSNGEARLSFKSRAGASVIDELYQAGCLKLRFPLTHAPDLKEAVLINTAGGLTGGDALKTTISWGAGTSAVVSSQAAERIYRAPAGAAQIESRFAVADGACGLWLPQETIFFDGGAMARLNHADVAAGGRFLATESLVFGRAAMGEHVASGQVCDGWRIRYGGRLVYADALRLDAPLDAMLARPAITGGHQAMATVLYAGRDADEHLPHWREAVSGLHGLAGCSCIGPVLAARILGVNGDAMRRDLTALLERILQNLNPGPGSRLPRVWQC